MMPVTGDGVERNALHLPMEETITREIERIDFDFCILAGDDKPNVAVRNHCLNFEFAVARDNDRERLRRRDHASDRVHCELLDDSLDWCGQNFVAWPYVRP